MIFETNESFPFDRLTLLTPKPIPGGNHFSRFHIDDSPIFIHLPKCSTKQGIQTSGTKKAYTDLQFTNDQERFLKWLETLTEKVQEIVFDNSTTWFANEMDKAEIEETFQSPLKPFRSGQQYLMRVNIPIRLGKITLPIFDENETPIESQMVKTGGHLLGVLEIQGLKFSQKSLQLEMEMKQILLLPSSSIFEKCILSTSAHNSSHISKQKTSTTPIPTTPTPTSTTPPKIEILETVEIQPLAIETNPENTTDDATTENKTAKEEEAITMNLDDLSETQPEPVIQDPPKKDPELPLPPPEDELQDVDICLENMTLQPIDTTIQLKNSKEIYYKMYRQARQKAKLARDLAISSYLESKHIKNIYVLEDLSDDEDEVSFFTVDSQWQKKKPDQNI